MASTESMLPQAHMVTPAVVETPGTTEHDARSGGNIMTVADPQTRPQEMHSAKEYQSVTGTVPTFIAYTDLTQPKGSVKG